MVRHVGFNGISSVVPDCKQMNTPHLTTGVTKIAENKGPLESQFLVFPFWATVES